MANEDQSIVEADSLPKRFYQTNTFRLLSMLSLTFTYFLVEIIVGNITNSVALVADAFHMLSDVISLVIAIAAVRMSKRRSDINTYGWVRAEVVGANINTVFLLALCLTIVFDAIKRFITPEPIKNVNLLLIVGSIGLGINIIGLFLFQGFHGHSHGGGGGGGAHGHSHGDGGGADGHTHTNKSHGHSHDHADALPKEYIQMNDIGEENEVNNKFERHSTRALQEVIAECAHQTDDQSDTILEIDDGKAKKSEKKASMNMHGVFLHVLADALGSVVVIISALLIKFVPHDPQDARHWTVYIDPSLSVIIVVIITISAIPLFTDTSYILLQTIPRHLQIDQIKSQLLSTIPEISGIHELHVWRLTNEKIIVSAHLIRTDLSNYMIVAENVKKFFHSLGIHSATIQYETVGEDINAQNPLSSVSHEEEKIVGDCLLRCENEECDTQTCCTKSSDRRSILLNENDTMRVIASNRSNTDDNNPH